MGEGDSEVVRNSKLTYSKETTSFSHGKQLHECRFAQAEKRLILHGKRIEERDMAHDLTYPEALGTLLTRLPELEIALGPQAKPGLESLRLSLQEAVMAHTTGDVPRATACIGKAMDTLSQLAALLDPQEAMMMRILATQFHQALGRGDDSEARRVSDFMREKSGTTLRKKT
jgi:hypothetical protein